MRLHHHTRVALVTHRIMAFRLRMRFNPLFTPPLTTALYCLPNLRRSRLMSSSSQPPWLASILQDRSPAPRIYSWTPHGYRHPPPRADDALDPRRIYILGVGNMGRLYATSLAKLPSPPPITLVFHRKELLSDWEASGGVEMTRLGITERDNKALFDVEYWAESPPQDNGGTVREILDGGQIGNLIIGTKASLAIPEVDRLRRYLGPRSTVAFTQNGMNMLWPPHGQTYVSSRYPSPSAAPNFVHCITGHGLINLGPFRSRHAALADVKVGPVLPSGSAAETYLIEQIAAAPHLDSVAVSRADLWALQLEKLVFNTVINPLTAVLRVKNGVLFASQEGPLVAVIDRLLHETSAVYRSLVSHPSTAEILAASPSELTLARRRLDERFSFARLRSIMWEFGLRVGENRSSMLQDVTAGKGTEIRDLNGWIVDMARFIDATTATTAPHPTGTATTTTAAAAAAAVNTTSTTTAATAAATTTTATTATVTADTALATDGPDGATVSTWATTSTAGGAAATRGATHHVVSAHETLMGLVERGQVLDQEQLARVILVS